MSLLLFRHYVKLGEVPLWAIFYDDGDINRFFVGGGWRQSNACKRTGEGQGMGINLETTNIRGGDGNNFVANHTPDKGNHIAGGQ